MKSSGGLRVDAFMAAVRERLYAKVTEFKEIHEAGLFDLEIEILPAGELPRNPRTGKVRTVCDERQS